MDAGWRRENPPRLNGRAGTAPPPVPARGMARTRNGRRGTPRNHVVGIIGRSPGVPRPGPSRGRPFSSRRLLGIGDPAHGSPPPGSDALAGGGVRRPSDQSPRLRARLVVGGPSDLSLRPRGPGPALRPTRPRRLASPMQPGAMAKPGHRRGAPSPPPSPPTRSAGGPPVWEVSARTEPRNRNIVNVFWWSGGGAAGARPEKIRDGPVELRVHRSGSARRAKIHSAARNRANPASRSACRSARSSRPMWKRRPGPPGFHRVAVR